MLEPKQKINVFKDGSDNCHLLKYCNKGRQSRLESESKLIPKGR